MPSFHSSSVTSLGDWSMRHSEPMRAAPKSRRYCHSVSAPIEWPTKQAPARSKTSIICCRSRAMRAAVATVEVRAGWPTWARASQRNRRKCDARSWMKGDHSRWLAVQPCRKTMAGPDSPCRHRCSSSPSSAVKVSGCKVAGRPDRQGASCAPMLEPMRRRGTMRAAAAGAGAGSNELGGLGMQEYDLFVIGGGSGGARMAAQRGARVALAEAGALGGTCVNLGCIPKKLYSYAAHYGEAFEESHGFGWSGPAPRFDWETLKRNRAIEIMRLNGVYEKLLIGAGVQLMRGRARFADPHTVDVDGERVRASHIL